MKIFQWLKQFTAFLHEDAYLGTDQLQDTNSYLTQKVKALQNNIDKLETEIETLKTKQEPIVIPEPQKTAIEKFCAKNYKSIPVPAYTQKRAFHDKDISVYLNQLIRPEQFEVQNVLRKLSPLPEDVRDAAVKIGDWAAKTFTWTDDGNLAKSGDYYLYPEESIVYKKVDCEDHAFTVASLHEGIAVAYGFYDDGRKRFGHAWNVFVYNGTLYHLETTANIAQIWKDSSDHPYTTHYIITRANAYEVKKGVRFGEIATFDS